MSDDSIASSLARQNHDVEKLVRERGLNPRELDTEKLRKLEQEAKDGRMPQASQIFRALQKLGVIAYRRGRITVLDRPQLEQLSCECYAVVKEETDRLLPRRLARGAGTAPLDRSTSKDG